MSSCCHDKLLPAFAALSVFNSVQLLFVCFLLRSSVDIQLQVASPTISHVGLNSLKPLECQVAQKVSRFYHHHHKDLLESAFPQKAR